VSNDMIVLLRAEKGRIEQDVLAKYSDFKESYSRAFSESRDPVRGIGGAVGARGRPSFLLFPSKRLGVAQAT
jgi:hypothetical protein